LEKEISQPETISNMSRYTELTKLHKSSGPMVEKAREYLAFADDIEEWTKALNNSDDPEMQKAADEELQSLKSQVGKTEEELKVLLIPKDPTDFKNVFLEIRAGTGGDEASIFAGDLFKMYRSFAESQKWNFQVISLTEGTMGGYKEIISEIKGDECYGMLKHESGVHRVQRVPQTESQGRVHTSASTVAVMPEAEDVDVDIKDLDLRIDTYRSSGHGGQSVNTTDSAIRITHIPSGLVVTCQDEKSQLKNKDKAMKVLRSRLLDLHIAEQQRDRAAQRKSQVGTGDRSAKIRTYNFPQGRVTDHRINLTLYSLDQIIKGDLTQVIESLNIAANMEKMKELEQSE